MLVIVPLYYAMMIAEIVFTIFAPPSFTTTSLVEENNITLANDLLSLFFHTAIMVSVLVFGFGAENWRVKGE